ncbi:MAG: aldo/keto reductase [Oscillospiraceae bacterium]|nr:aldo/keto reductase [Oscillospiraceae bacterium]
MRHIPFPRLGQGGWMIGEDPARAEEEIAALRLGLELGLTLIDTAEMYGEGRSERLIGRAVAGRPREGFALVSKVYPHNAGRDRLRQSCEDSLRRLGTEYLDLYLLHWRGAVPLAETAEGMETLVREGKIRAWGVSNFDTADMEELWSVPGGDRCAANQVLYHIGSRGIEYDLLPWMAERGVACMAYCPLAQGGRLARMGQDLRSGPALLRAARAYHATVPQILLAFTLRRGGVTAIPKAGGAAHVRENAAALDLRIQPEDWAALDEAFPPPTSKMHLDIE